MVATSEVTIMSLPAQAPNPTSSSLSEPGYIEPAGADTLP
jgi:hypothetical protein